MLQLKSNARIKGAGLRSRLDAAGAWSHEPEDSDKIHCYKNGTDMIYKADTPGCYDR